MDEALSGNSTVKERIANLCSSCSPSQSSSEFPTEYKEKSFGERLFGYAVPLFIVLFLSFLIGNLFSVTILAVEHKHDFFSPFSKEQPLFPQQDLNVVPITSYFGSIQFPYPTNTNWIGSILPGVSNTTPNYEIAVINTWPYFIHMTDQQGPSISFISSSADVNDCSNPYFYCVSVINQTSEYRPGATFGIPTFSSTSNFTSRAISSHDLLSVTYRWGTSDDTSKDYMECPMVQGSPYFTCVYNNIPPFLTKPVGPALQYVNGTDIAANPNFNITTNALNWTLATAEGQGQQVWVFYTADPVNWICSMTGCTLSSPPKEIAIRVAHNPTDLYYKYRDVYPIGCDVQVDVNSDDDDETNQKDGHASILFNWNTAALDGSDDGDEDDLVIFALPHHRQILSSHTKINNDFQLQIGLVGNVNGVMGNSWKMEETLSSLYWWRIGEVFTANQTDQILFQLQVDMPNSPIMNVTDPYGFGKEIARLGRLALIADEFGQVNSSVIIRNYMKISLESALGIENEDGVVNSDPLKYEGTYGGVCSTNGLDTPGEPWAPGGAADYGNGIYNDHHYHYGYWIYGIAAVIKEDPDWYLNNTQLQNLVLSLCRDFANPSKEDPYFTQFRYKDWYVGHSWASGLQVIADGTNQESISEAINAYYGLSLLGKALNNTHMRDVGRLLASMEIRSAQTYWQIIPSTNTIYPPSFAALGIASQQFADKATYAVFFECGNDVTVCNYGINIIPITPVTGLLLNYQWVDETYSLYAAADFTGLNQWEGFRIADYAVIDQNDAWNQAINYPPPYDNGFSLTALEHFIATRSSSSVPLNFSFYYFFLFLFVVINL